MNFQGTGKREATTFTLMRGKSGDRGVKGKTRQMAGIPQKEIVAVKGRGVSIYKLGT